MAKNSKNKDSKAGAKNSGQVQISQSQQSPKAPETTVRKTRPDTVLVELTVASVVNKQVVGAKKVVEVSQKEAEKLYRNGKAKPYVEKKSSAKNTETPANPPAPQTEENEVNDDEETDLTGDEDEGSGDE
ncbi:MAG: hypothetical protein AB7F28_00270 [Candidatus Margulisiibacteriota bacterium]